MRFLKPKPSPAENRLLCDGNVVARVEVVAHDHELRGWLIESDEELLLSKTMNLEDDEPMSTNEDSLLGRAIDWLDCNRYKFESREDSRMGMLYLFRKGRAYRVEFSRSSNVLDDNPVNQFIDQVGRHLPILINP